MSNFQVQAASATRDAKKKKAKKWKPKGEYTPFPPPQQPSKIDLQLESGEFFMNERTKKLQKKADREARQAERVEQKKQERAAQFKAPAEKPRMKRSAIKTDDEPVNIKKLKKKAKK